MLRCQGEIPTVVLDIVPCFLLLSSSSETVNGSDPSTARETQESLKGTGGFTSQSCSFDVCLCRAFQMRSLKSQSCVSPSFRL